MTARQPLATPEEVATHLQVTVKTLKNWRSLRTGPRFTKVGARVRYRWADIEKWCDDRAGVAA
jgi:predicted DNA-binding transcriptional regulator AlpA